MTGKYSLRISNKYVCYNFEIKRKVTIVRGHGATGKSYMAYLSTEHLKVSSIECEVKVINLGYSIENWLEVIQNKHNCIFIVDENFPYIKDDEFCRAILDSDNYFILITRYKLANLPYSLFEIYYLVSEYKADNTTYTTFANLYLDNVTLGKVDLLITEDSNSGFQFFEKALNGKIVCKPACGKSNIKYVLLDEMQNYNSICAIVDGSAFGADIEELFEYAKLCKCEFYLLAPESFEYLLLKSGAFNCNKNYLDETYNYHDINTFRSIVSTERTNEIESWEDFYTELLRCLSRVGNQSVQYDKTSLKPFYYRYANSVLKLLGFDV